MNRIGLWESVFLISVLLAGALGWIAYLNYQEVKDLEIIIDRLSVDTPKTDTTPSKSDSGFISSINPHEIEIKAIESGSGVFLSRISKLIIRDEGNRSKPYLDPSGHVTIGVGRNLEGNGISVSELHAIAKDIDYRLLMESAHIQNGRIYIKSIDLANKVFSKPLTNYDVQLLLTDDLRNSVNDAKKVFGDSWQSLDGVRKEVITDLLFNLGITRFKGFVEFIKAVKAKDWNKAASELLLSNAARENIIRYHRNAVVLQTGDERHFDL